MRTEDFLADLERQLAGARPRRRPPATLLAVPVLALVAAAAFLLGGPEGEREATQALPGTAVVVENGTGDAAIGEQARDRLAGAGYEVTLRTPLNGVRAAESAILGADPEDERRIRDLLNLDPAGGWTSYGRAEASDADGSDPPIAVLLGADQRTDDSPVVSLLDASGSETAARVARERLEAAGFIVDAAFSRLPLQQTQVFEADGTEVAELRRTLSLPPGPSDGDALEFLKMRGSATTVGSVVVVGTDFAPTPLVVVVNAGASSETVASAATELEKAGYGPVAVRDSPGEVTTSSVVAGPPEAADPVADLLGLPSAPAEDLPTPRDLWPTADALVVLGPD